jgi:hypothetical protein
LVYLKLFSVATHSCAESVAELTAKHFQLPDAAPDITTSDADERLAQRPPNHLAAESRQSHQGMRCRYRTHQY